MVDPARFYRALKARGVGLFAGVPDSLLKSFCAFVDDNAAAGEHIIAANEGNALAIAAGHHLATGNVAAVYMQNSGLGNAVNPIASLADGEVYRIPVLLIVGWRGEPGVHDEPQHVKQGKVTLGQLDLLGIPYRILDAGSDYEKIIAELFDHFARNGTPAAIVVRKDAFAEYDSEKKRPALGEMKREEALELILAGIGPEALVVSTTGKTSREVFELRAKRGEAQRDFLTVGSMGHTSSIALGVALGRPERKVVCLDGDGSALMHLGALPIVGSLKPANLVHVLLNNGAHESVGGQATVAGSVDFRALSAACGYRSYLKATSAAELSEAVKSIAGLQGPVLLEVYLKQGSRKELGRPTSTPEANKAAFMAAGCKET
jgi:phosphonopyruvate decarboxylase